MNVISSLPDSLPISMINLIGTHDSATAFCSFEKNARCQDRNIIDQFEMGVRLFDIRLCRKSGEYYLCHSLADCYSSSDKEDWLTFGDVLGYFHRLLLLNPREIIVMSVKQDRGIESKKFFEPLFDRFAYSFYDGETWYGKNHIPTLGECRGRIVLMRRCKVKKSFAEKNEGKLGLDFSCWEDQDKPVFYPLPLTISGDISAMIQDRYRLSPKKKWESCAKPFLESCEVSDRQIAIHFLSTSSKGVNPLAAAEYINPKFMQWEIKRPVGWIFADFVDEKLIEKVMMSNMGDEKK